MWLLTALFLWPLSWDKHYRKWTPLSLYLPHCPMSLKMLTLLRLVFLMFVSTSTRDHSGLNGSDVVLLCIICISYSQDMISKHFWLWNLLESLGQQGIKPVNPKGNQTWIFIGRTDAEAEAPLLWPPDSKSWLTRKDPDAGKDWGQEEKGSSRRWDGWVTSLTQWTWVWANPGR